VTIERHITLDSTVNFRDIGGYETTDGRRIRWRTLFRADGLSHLSEPDRAAVRKLGIATVVDLRTHGELDSGQFPIDDIPVDFHHVPLIAQVIDPTRFSLVPGMLGSRYQEIAREGAPQIGRVLRIVAERHAHPLIVHCSAGKDRTGILVAVLMSTLGVPDESIVADYALSARAMEQLRERAIARNPQRKELYEQSDELFSAAPANIVSLFADLRRDFGSIDGYLAWAGAGPEISLALQETLLEPVP
jgi:protein-tyrosine phosphatase